MIFITGCARSGTSLITRILQAHGCNLGKVNVLWENTSIRQEVLKPYLESIGSDKLGQRLPMPTREQAKPRPNLREDILKRIPGSEPRAFKDAKLCWVYWPFAKAFPEAKWIVVRRTGNKIVESCLRPHTSEGYGRFMLYSDDPLYWETWVRAHEDRFNQMRKELDMVEVWPDQVMQNPSSFEHITKHCGLAFNKDAITQCIDPAKWHGAATADATAAT